jgi:hypothetical protein
VPPYLCVRVGVGVWACYTSYVCVHLRPYLAMNGVSTTSEVQIPSITGRNWNPQGLLVVVVVDPAPAPIPPCCFASAGPVPVPVLVPAAVPVPVLVLMAMG